MKQTVTVVLPTRPYGQLTITEDRRVCSVCCGPLPCQHEAEAKVITVQHEPKTTVLDLRDYTRPARNIQTR